MRVPLHVKCILLVQALAVALHKGYDTLVELKMQSIEKSTEALRSKREYAYARCLQRLNEADQVHRKLKKRALAEEKKTMLELEETEDKYMTVTQLLLKGA